MRMRATEASIARDPVATGAKVERAAQTQAREPASESSLHSRAEWQIPVSARIDTYAQPIAVIQITIN